MPAILIDEVADHEIEATVILWQRCGLTRPWNDPRADIAFARAQPNSTVLVRRLDDEIVASVMIGHDGHRGAVYYVAVDPAARRKGLGREIMAAAEDWLRAQGVWKLNLMVREGNTGAVAFYAAIGYEVEERVAMAKWIDPAKRPS